MTEMGVIHGRFQVFHNDHLKYLMAGRARCRHLVVGITNPDPTLTRADAADPNRSDPRANPLTYFERLWMLRAVLEEAQVEPEEYSIVPLPINFPDRLAYYVPPGATFYVTIYDDWGRKKLEMFTGLGITTELLWERPQAEKGISGVEVRSRMVRREPWEQLVPPSVARLMKEWRIPERLRGMLGEEAQPA